MEEMDKLVRESLFFDLRMVKIETELFKAAKENEPQTSRKIMNSWHFFQHLPSIFLSGSA